MNIDIFSITLSNLFSFCMILDGVPFLTSVLFAHVNPTRFRWISFRPAPARYNRHLCTWSGPGGGLFDKWPAETWLTLAP